jgi:hypothetical protein
MDPFDHAKQVHGHGVLLHEVMYPQEQGQGHLLEQKYSGQLPFGV